MIASGPVGKMVWLQARVDFMRERVIVCVLALALFGAGGCVTRELVITSDPEGATVRINETYEGTTPYTHRFTHYQVFGIRLEKDGYYPLYAKERVEAPFYEKPGVDFVSEALIPKRMHDRREFHYKLEKIDAPDPLDAVIQRAEATRDHIQATRAEQAARDVERAKPGEAATRIVPLPVKKDVREAEAEEARLKAAEEEETPGETGDDAPEGGSAESESQTGAKQE